MNIIEELEHQNGINAHKVDCSDFLLRAGQRERKGGGGGERGGGPRRGERIKGPGAAKRKMKLTYVLHMCVCVCVCARDIHMCVHAPV